MNDHIADNITIFCKKSQNYSLPNGMQMNIIHLNYFATEWLRLRNNLDPQTVEYINENIQKIIICLVEKISNGKISTELINIFSEIIIEYMDEIQKNDSMCVSELSNMFNKMALSYPNSKKNVSEISKMQI
jgi:hypothetical protein